MGDILAVVVKWYTRYFEGVVGASPCEFDSHLPHKRKPDGFPPGFFRISYFTSFTPFGRWMSDLTVPSAARRCDTVIGP